MKLSFLVVLFTVVGKVPLTVSKEVAGKCYKIKEDKRGILFDFEIRDKDPIQPRNDTFKKGVDRVKLERGGKVNCGCSYVSHFFKVVFL